MKDVIKRQKSAILYVVIIGLFITTNLYSKEINPEHNIWHNNNNKAIIELTASESDINAMSKEYAWNGFLNIEITKRFQCEVIEQVSEIRNEEILADDEYTQKVNIKISMDDFNFDVSPSIPGTSLIRDASGKMHCIISEDHFTATRSIKTECHNKEEGSSWAWVSPGNWNTKHETLTGKASRSIKKENIILIIVKDMELDKEGIKDLQQQMQEAAKNQDYATVQKLKDQMVGKVQGNQSNNEIPIRIQIQLIFDITKKDFVTKTFEHITYDACLNRIEEDEDGPNNIERTIAQPIGVEMRGTYIKGKDGNDIINASVNIMETTRSKIFTGKCPDATVKISGQINLERKRK